MRCDDENIFADTIFKFPGTGFWLVHILGTLAIFSVGLKLGQRRSLTITGMAFNLLRMLAARR